MKQKLNNWKHRNLSLSGKVLSLKTFGLSQILYLSSVYKVPKWAITEIEFIMSDFLWNGKQHKVKAKVIIQQIKHGG